MLIFIIFTTSMLISVALIFLNSFLAKKNIQEREKPSAFECGFDPKSSSRLPFSLRFYLIAVIFLIFDVEITLIIPLPIILKISNLTILSSMFTFFVVILALGLYHEWKQGALEWK